MFETTIDKNKPPIVQPWKTIDMNPKFSGQWIVAGDLDNDGVLDIEDLYAFEQNPVDLNRDGVADGTDLARFAQEYGGICP